MADIISSIWPEWHTIRVIGKDSYSTVYEAESTDPSVKSRAAIRVISIPQTEAEQVDDLISEIMMMESLKGARNIVSVDDYRVTEKASRSGWDIYIRTELVTPVSAYLASYHMNDKEIADLGIDICTALERYEKINVVHGDIRPENIFVNDSGVFKLGKFGTFGNAYDYMAPETARGERKDSSADIYSLGLVLYMLANENRLPFLNVADQADPSARAEVIRRRLSGEPLPAPSSASFELAQIIDIACQADPDERFGSASAMKTALQALKSELENRKKAAPVPAAAPVMTASAQKAVSSKLVREDIPEVSEPYGKASAKSVQAQTVYRTSKSEPAREEPEKRRSPARIIVPIAIAATFTMLMAALAIIFLPKILGAKSEGVAIESPAKPVQDGSEQQALTTPETAAPATTVQETATPPATTQETTTEAKRQFTVGEIISFGHYEQDANTANGKEEVEWIVLDVQDDRVLAISRMGLDGQQYDTSGNTKVTWETCTLRQWLNSSFINNAFSADEQEKILESRVTADKNSKYPDKNPGNDTWDKVFLLSTSEAERYFSSDKSRIMQPTSYALSMGVTYCNNDNDQGYGYWWWLRTPGDVRTDTTGTNGPAGTVYNAAALIYPEGKIDYKGSYYFDTENAVRPAMWIAR